MGEWHRYAIITASPLPGGWRLGVVLTPQGVSQVDLLSGDAPLCSGINTMESQIRQQLSDYFRNPLSSVEMPLHFSGTPYQQRVWHALREIPVGTTCTYGELARKLGSGPRAIAAACRSNPLPILVPCHRVIAKAGLGGYMGATAGEAMILKEWLLRHEGAFH